MVKIEFRGKEISKLEAKTLIDKLKLGFTSPDLNEQEQKSYVIWKNAMESLNSKKLSEKRYLIGEIKSRIQAAEFAEKIKYCKKYGHTEDWLHICSGQSGTKVYANCARCGMNYERNLSVKEWENFDKMMNTPMSI